MFLGIQLIGLIFGLFMLYLSFLYSKKQVFTSREWIVWTGIWIIFLVLSLFPQLIDPLVDRLKLARAMDFFISCGFMLFAGIIFYTYNITRNNQRKLEDLTRETAFLAMKLDEHGKH